MHHSKLETDFEKLDDKTEMEKGSITMQIYFIVSGVLPQDIKVVYRRTASISLLQQ